MKDERQNQAGPDSEAVEGGNVTRTGDVLFLDEARRDDWLLRQVREWTT